MIRMLFKIPKKFNKIQEKTSNGLISKGRFWKNNIWPNNLYHHHATLTTTCCWLRDNLPEDKSVKNPIFQSILKLELYYFCSLVYPSNKQNCFPAFSFCFWSLFARELRYKMFQPFEQLKSWNCLESRDFPMICKLAWSEEWIFHFTVFFSLACGKRMCGKHHIVSMVSIWFAYLHARTNFRSHSLLCKHALWNVHHLNRCRKYIPTVQ
jgi:hypothetical protein